MINACSSLETQFKDSQLSLENWRVAFFKPWLRVAFKAYLTTIICYCPEKCTVGIQKPTFHIPTVILISSKFCLSSQRSNGQPERFMFERRDVNAVTGVTRVTRVGSQYSQQHSSLSASSGAGSHYVTRRKVRVACLSQKICFVMLPHTLHVTHSALLPMGQNIQQSSDT